MTVVLWDGKMLAADTRVTHNTKGRAPTYTDDACKIHVIADLKIPCAPIGDDYLVAITFAGSVGLSNSVLTEIKKYKEGDGPVVHALLSTFGMQLEMPKLEVMGLSNTGRRIVLHWTKHNPLGWVARLRVYEPVKKQGDLFDIIGTGGSHIRSTMNSDTLKKYDSADMCFLISAHEDNCGGYINYITLDNLNIRTKKKPSARLVRDVRKLLNAL